jgi:hypothetical protein
MSFHRRSQGRGCAAAAIPVLAVTLLLLGPARASAQAALLTGFGGAAGFGVDYLPANDDGSTGAISLTAAFPAGVNFFGTTYTSAYVNNNGNITFNAAVYGYTPTAFPISSQPMLAPYWGDVDTRGGSVAGIPGSNLVYYYVDVPGRRFIVTWYDVGYYSYATSLLNSFQLILTDHSAGDFGVEYRFNRPRATPAAARGASAAPKPRWAGMPAT